MPVIDKIRILWKLATDKRFRQDVNSLRHGKPLFIVYAWQLLCELGLKEMLVKGSSLEEIQEKKKIKNRKMLECILDLLVGNGVLKFDGKKYFFVKEPKAKKENRLFLEKNYPASVEWVDLLRTKASKVLKTGKPEEIAGFGKKGTLELWDRLMQETPHSFRLYAIKKIIKELKEGNKILDFGCGSGLAIELLLKHNNKRVFLTGFDSSKYFIEKARERLKRMEKEVTGITKENLKKVVLTSKKQDLHRGEFDFVFMSLVLNHIDPKKRKAIYKYAYDLLKPCGKLVIYQILHESKFKRNPIWVMHIVPSHKDYPFKEEFYKELRQVFPKVKGYLAGHVAIAIK